MAHLWTLDGVDCWTPSELIGDAANVPAGADGAAGAGATAGVDTVGRARLRRLADPPHVWALLSTAPALRLNGEPIPIGLAVLDDRDEIRLPGLSAWFSTETLARVEPFPGDAPRGCCPRCQRHLPAASPAVRCPACGLWHHASEESPCWAYAATCAACPQETALEAGYRWTPEEL